MIERMTISIKEAAAALGISDTHAYAMAKRGEIPTVKVGCRVLVPVEKLRRKLMLPDVTSETDN